MAQAGFNVIAIDGPAASGKSTVAKLVAEKLGYIYVDSGSMYRAVTLLWLDKIKSENLAQIKENKEANQKTLDEILASLQMELVDNSKKIFANGNDVSTLIRSNLISQNVSYIASFANVRATLVGLQRKIALTNNIIMDGRDIGSFVFPDARLKIFLTASPEVRADRRFKELKRRGEHIDLAQLVAEIKERDRLDSSREIAPLKKAASAIEISTDNLSIQQTVEKIITSLGL